MIKFGKSYFGYVWIFLEPSLHIAMWVVIFGFIRQRHVDDMSIFLFLLTGVVPFLYISSYLNKCTKTMKSIKAVLNYQPVKPIDTLVATLIVDTSICIILFVTGVLILLYINDPFVLYNPLRLLYIGLELVFLIFGLGLILSIFGYYYIDAPFVITILMRILYFTSGAIIPLEIIPDAIRAYLEYNPFYQIIALIRTCFSPKIIPSELSNIYVFNFTICAIFLGLALYFTSRHNILMNAKAR
jgi:capsular polysaccharide transport system permease protein